MTHAPLSVPGCRQCRMRLNPRIRRVLQAAQRQCSSIKIALILNKHPVEEIGELHPHADAAEAKPQRFSCVHTLVRVLSAGAALPFRVLHKVCRWLAIFFFWPDVRVYRKWSSHVHALCYSGFLGRKKKRKVASISCTRAKPGIRFAAVVLYFSRSFHRLSSKNPSELARYGT